MPRSRLHPTLRLLRLRRMSVRPEDSANKKLAVMPETIPQLVATQRQTLESQKAFLGNNNATMVRKKAPLENYQTMTEAFKAHLRRHYKKVQGLIPTERWL